MKYTKSLSNLLVILTIAGVKNQLTSNEFDVKFNYENLLSNFWSRNGYSRCEKPKQFDDLRLAVQWVPGTCLKNDPREKTCRSVNDRFTIHGLWPSNNYVSSQMNCCSDNRFSMEKIRHLLPRLKVSW